MTASVGTGTARVRGRIRISARGASSLRAHSSLGVSAASSGFTETMPTSANAHLYQLTNDVTNFLTGVIKGLTQVVLLLVYLQLTSCCSVRAELNVKLSRMFVIP